DPGALSGAVRELPGCTGGIEQLRELIDELDTLGALRSDLAQFYGLNIDDVWNGTLSVRHVLWLAENLVLNPHSRAFAIRGGSPELQGWDAATVIAARTHNHIVALIQGLSGSHDPDMYIDYPGSKPEEKQPATLAELTVAGFTQFMYG